MRQAIKAQLLTELPQLTAVYAYGESVPQGSEPYAVLVQGEERFENAWAGYRRSYEVRLYPGPGGGMADGSDGLAAQAVQSLHRRRLPIAGGGAFSCLYEGALGEETAEPPADPAAVKLRFGVRGLRYEAAVEPETEAGAGAEAEAGAGAEAGVGVGAGAGAGAGAEVTPSGADPWLAALGSWSLQRLGPGWSSYCGQWPQDYQPPAILWRITGMKTEALSSGAIEVTKRLTGHVLGAGSRQEEEAVLRLLSGLAAFGKIPLTANAGDGTAGATGGGSVRFLTVADAPTAELGADAFGTGQLSLVLRCKTAISAEEKPLVGKVNFTMG